MISLLKAGQPETGACCVIERRQEPLSAQKPQMSPLRHLIHPLIHDWNQDAAPDGAARPLVMLDDETLRDGLQSPSVRTPGIDEKIDILQRMDALGIDTANIGLPGAGAHVVADVERLARAIGEGRLDDQGQLRRADRRCRHPADRRDRAAHRRADRVLRVHRLEPHSAVRRRVDARLPPEDHRGGHQLRRQAGSHGDVRHRRHDSGRSRFAARAVHDGAPRGRVPSVHRGHRRTRLAERRQGRRPLRQGRCSTSSARTPASTGTVTAIAGSASRRRWRRSKRARRGSTAPRSASASAAATRRSICCSSTW